MHLTSLLFVLGLLFLEGGSRIYSEISAKDYNAARDWLIGQHLWPADSQCVLFDAVLFVAVIGGIICVGLIVWVFQVIQLILLNSAERFRFVGWLVASVVKTLADRLPPDHFALLAPCHDTFGA